MARKDAISQYSADVIGIGVYENNAYVDPDNQEVFLQITRLADNKNSLTDTIVVGPNEPANREDVGLYWYEVSSGVTAFKSEYKASWSYLIDGEPRLFEYDFTVVNPQPYWDSLDATQKGIVENIYFKLSDGFDSTVGGPYLWELPQSSFGYETIARLTVVDGMNSINFEGPKAFNPPYTFGATGTNHPIPPSWYGLVQKAGFYETLKHMSRAYLEIPLPVNVQTAHLDRTRYSQLYSQMAAQEGTELLRQVHMIKRAMALGVRYRSKLLAGGIFPISYLNPARPRWPYVLTRFY